MKAPQLPEINLLSAGGLANNIRTKGGQLVIDYVNERAIQLGLQVSYNGLDQVEKAADRGAGYEGEDSEQFHYDLLQTMHRTDVQFPQFEEAAHLFEQATVGNSLDHRIASHQTHAEITLRIRLDPTNPNLLQFTYSDSGVGLDLAALRKQFEQHRKRAPTSSQEVADIVFEA